jgi:hypothetical protein
MVAITFQTYVWPAASATILREHKLRGSILGLVFVCAYSIRGNNDGASILRGMKMAHIFAGGLLAAAPPSAPCNATTSSR